MSPAAASGATSTGTTTVSVTSGTATTPFPSGGSPATHALLPATFELRPGGSLSPPTISVPSGVPVQLTVLSSDSKAHQLVLRSPHPHQLKVPAHGRATTKVTGLPKGQYAITIDGAKRGSLILGAQPGP